MPELLPRFLPIGKRGLVVPLEWVIRHFLAWLFPMMGVVECTTFRVTRDADFAVSDEADVLLEAVELSCGAGGSATPCASRSPARARRGCSSS